MRLLGTPTSPFVRKVHVVAAELGLGDRLAFEPVVLANSPPDLITANPLRKVPTLIADDGTAVFDSPVIMEWLDAEFGEHRLLPVSGPRRWTALIAAAVADGVLEAGAAARSERAKPPEQQSAAAIDKQLLKVNGGLDWLETNRAWRESNMPDLGQIATAVAVGWLYFRIPDLVDAKRWPALVAWYQGFAERPSMISTAPPAPA